MAHSSKRIPNIEYMTRLWKSYFPIDRILAQRIFKSTINSTVALIFCLIPKVRDRLGTAPAMLPLISVIVHPGRRVSGTIQGAVYCITGLIFGLAYALFGKFIAMQCIGPTWRTMSEADQYKYNYKRYEAGLAILSIFEIFMLFFHGWMRSVSHHYFAIVFPLFLVVHFTFLAPITDDYGVIANTFSTPFYLGIAMSLFWNIVLFPEFGSTYLGNATIDALNEIHKDINESIKFFICLGTGNGNTKNDTNSNNNNNTMNSNEYAIDKNIQSPDYLYETDIVTLSKLLKFKTLVSKKINNCNLVLQECMYEISYSYVPPYSINEVLEKYKQIAIYINGIVNACQLQFILLGRNNDDDDGNNTELLEKHMNLHNEKEITYADADKLLYVIDHLRKPIYNLHQRLSKCIYYINILLAYSYDVKFDRVFQSKCFKQDEYNLRVTKKTELPSIEDIDSSIKELESELTKFGEVFKEEIFKIDHDLLSPNDEMFLFSSFLMNLKEITNETIKLTRVTKQIFVDRQAQEKKGWIRGKRVWFTFLKNFKSMKNWYVGNSVRITENDTLKGVVHYNGQSEVVAKRPDVEEDDLLMQRTSTHRASISTEKHLLPITTRNSTGGRVRTDFSTQIVNMLIWINNICIRTKSHFIFGFQVTVALMTASFPMFVPKIRAWYIDYEGAWIGFVCILCMEPSVGGTFWVFFLRAVGVILGAFWGMVSYWSGVNQTNPYLETVITVFGAVPGFYYLLGTPYVKAAIIQIISIYIVMLAAIIPSETPHGIVDYFAKRCLAVGYGGVIALIVQVLFYPVKARDQLTSEVAFVCGCISNMELIFASGLEGEITLKPLDDSKYQQIVRLSSSAKAALDRAKSYNGLTRQEPRLKGDFSELEHIFSQIIFIQRQIVERIDTAALLRKQYGSAIIEELNNIVYPYRRQLVGNLTASVRAVQEAFLTKTPLPQFMPSTRISHRRLINKVRQILERRNVELKRFDFKKSRFDDLSPLDPLVSGTESSSNSSSESNEGLTLIAHSKKIDLDSQGFLTKEKYLTWSASCAAMEEIIEYIEELVYLAKLVVGVNEFKYGFLSRPLYEDWAAEAIRGFDDFIKGGNANNKSSSSSSSSLSNDSHTEILASSPCDECNRDHKRNDNDEGANIIPSNSNNIELTVSDNDEDVSIDSDQGSAGEAYQPVQFNPKYMDGNDNGNMAEVSFPIVNRRESVNLARIATFNNGKKNPLPKSFRDRVYSIGFRSGLEVSASNEVDRTRTLGDVDETLEERDEYEDESDDDIPLALKRIVSSMKDKPKYNHNSHHQE